MLLISYLQVPESEDEWNSLVKEFDKMWNFRRVYEAMNGKHNTV